MLASEPVTSDCTSPLLLSGTIAPFWTRWPPGSHSPERAERAARIDHSVTHDEGGQGAALDLVDGGGDADLLFGEGLAAGEGEAGIAGDERVEQLGGLRPDLA